MIIVIINMKINKIKNIIWYKSMQIKILKQITNVKKFNNNQVIKIIVIRFVAIRI